MSETTLSVSCDSCQFDGTDTCNDCVVSFLLNHEPEDAIIFDAGVARAVRMLHDVGLVPKLRHQKRVC